jgi:hypothetical protein
MTKLSLLGVAAVAYAALAVPAFAQHKASHFVQTYAQGDSCANHEAGNPYSKQDDYMGWSAWRDRGGWDDRCAPTQMNHTRF